MAKNLLTISQGDFAKNINKIRFKTLKNLIEAIYDIKRSVYSSSPQEIICDIERKETKIWKELQRRGYDLNAPDFIQWIHKLQNKRKKIMITR